MKKEKNACAIKTSIGGQALIEGIMMRGPKMTAMAVRRQSGEIVIDKWETGKKPYFKPLDPEKVNEEVKQAPAAENEKPGALSRFVKACTRIPFVRGIFNMGISLSVGYKCLMRSADVYIEETPEEKAEREKKEAEGKKTGDPSSFGAIAGFISGALGILLAVGLFIVLPTFASEWIMRLCSLDPESTSYGIAVLRSAIEGVMKIVILVAYMFSVSFMKDIRRTFMYHGAEHKTIFCYEAGEELTVENVKKQTRLHPRCGTSFLVLTVLVSIIVGIFIPTAIPDYLRAIIKLLLLPLTMGISYELIKLAGKHDNIVTRIISAPGLLLQKITTVEPDDGMIECAILAMKEVIPSDGSDKIN